MASVLKAQKSNATKTELKSKGKRKAEVDADAGGEVDAPIVKKIKNRQRVLLLSSRGITHRMRHLMNDLEVLLPHIKKGTHPEMLLWHAAPSHIFWGG
jgi:ribosome biogenesis protein BRX1